MLLEGLPQVDSGLVTLGVIVAGIIAGYSRLESKTNTNSRDIERMEARQHEQEQRIVGLDNKVMDKLSKIETIVANIQGQLTK